MQDSKTRGMLVLGTLLAAIGATGCGSEDTHVDDGHAHDSGVVTDSGAVSDSGVVTDTGAVTSEVTLRFAAKVGDLPFRCGETFANVGTTGGQWSPTDFRFYVHDVRVVTAAGEVPVALTQDGRWQHESVALLDFEDRSGACTNGTAAMNAQVVGTLPAGTVGPITGVRFKLGVPFALNHANQALAPSPLNLSTLWWNWQGGYKFLRVDGQIMNPMNPAAASWYVHVGSTGCNGGASGGVTSCANPNRIEVELTGFDPSRNTVVADLAGLLSTSDVRVTRAAPGCMSELGDPECPPVLRGLGIGDGATQNFFRME